MMKLAERYGDRPQEEFGPIFQRILQNGINDQFRRSKVRNLWTTLLSAFSPNGDDDGGDPIEALGAESDSEFFKPPHQQEEQRQTLGVIEAEIAKLPPRQREAFLMRYWEEMDIAETAVAMGCSEGSVKTHCF